MRARRLAAESTPRPAARERVSLYRQVKQWLGSALFNAVMWVSVLVYAPLMLLTFPLTFRQRYYLITRWAAFQMWSLRVLCRLRYRVRGYERLPPGPAIVMAKHQSTWETLSLSLIFPPQTWVLKREVIWIPLFGWALAALKPIAIDRGSKREAIQQVIAQGGDRLNAGIWVTVFPEGTRVAPGFRRRWGQSGAVLAAQTGYPVVPVAHNAGHFWPRRKFLKRPGTIELIIGPTVASRGRSHEEILREAEDWVVRTMEELEGVKSEALPPKR
jgi:1-acyl-sn-glycerol-3-phosphate acyltransferase